MYRHSGELSELAHGQGLLSGGVEVECFADDLKAFTLTGQPILKPTDTIYGKTAKPYRKQQLAIPKTYVTRRGQMVLFTSSDDMIFGKSCQMHQKEVTTQHAVKQLKTTNKLFTSAMGYSADVSNGGVGHTSDLTVRAGHFTNVYLNSLQKAAQTQRAALQAAEECVVEDIEGEGEKKGENGDRAAVSSITCYAQVDGEPEAPLVECDSGLGHSISTSASGRLSAQSHASESVANTTVIHIPHGRESQQEDTDGEHDRTDVDKNTANALDALKMELGMSHKSKEQSTVKKKTGKKRRQTIGDKSQTEKSLKTTKSKKKSSSDSTSTTRKSLKSKRKRNKTESSRSSAHKEDKSVEAMMEFNQSISESTEGKGEKFEVTAVQLSGKESIGVMNDDRGVVGRLSRAEQRRIEIERKRAEKRALELEKKRQEEEQMRLQAQIDGQHTETEHGDTLSLESTNDEQDVVKLDADISAAHGNILTVEQKSLRNRLTQAKLRESRLLLAYRGEKMDTQLSDDIDSAEEALRLAQEAKERLERLKQKQERLRLLEDERRQKEELAQRSKIVDEKATKICEEHNKSMHQDLANQRIYQNVSKSFMFSYFRFVPPPKPKVEKKTRKARASKSLRTK